MCMRASLPERDDVKGRTSALTSDTPGPETYLTTPGLIGSSLYCLACIYIQLVCRTLKMSPHPAMYLLLHSLTQELVQSMTAYFQQS